HRHSGVDAPVFLKKNPPLTAGSQRGTSRLKKTLATSLSVLLRIFPPKSGLILSESQNRGCFLI
ncbi:MAG: hypothetical protein ACKVU2_04015, partial [Saprospiraceae bacterium]